MELNSKILITGGSGLVGTALRKALHTAGYQHIYAPSSHECDLTDFKATLALFENYQPAYVFHLAAAVFGIMGNMEQKGISFLHNILINTHVIEGCRVAKIKKIVAMGTGAAYPFPSPGVPLNEGMIWQGAPHPAEDSYGHSKRAMLAQLNAYQESYNLEFAFVISANLFGPHDKFDIRHGHVTPSLVRKFYEAKQQKKPVSIWGNGSAKRDFLYADDVAQALLTIMMHIQGPVNMGSGRINAIKDLVDILAEYTNMTDQLQWDASKPNGQDYRAYDLSKLFSAGFKPRVSFEEGVKLTYDWYAAHEDDARK